MAGGWFIKRYFWPRMTRMKHEFKRKEFATEKKEDSEYTEI